MKIIVFKPLVFVLILILQSNTAFAKKPIRKKCFNAQYLFIDGNHFTYTRSLLFFGFGQFKNKNKGFEFSLAAPIYQESWNSYSFETLNTAIKFNKFRTRPIGNKSNSIGYRYGLAYYKIFDRDRNGAYSYKEKGAFYKHTHFNADRLDLNIMAFLNFRMFKRSYIELGLSLNNGIERLNYKGGDIQEAYDTNKASYKWGDYPPGVFYRYSIMAHIKFLACFGKSKKR
jgi:hypothetical protein